MKAVAPPKITVCNRQQKIAVNIVELQDFAAKAVRHCLRLHKRKPTDLDELHDVFIWLISDRRMASLHWKFMHESGPTDVLTFQHGEIFIGVETAKRHARTYGNTLARELCLYIIHGLLHLNGFDDQTKTRSRKMERIQEKILATCLGLRER